MGSTGNSPLPSGPAPSTSVLARAMPSMTGSAASRWEGFAARYTWVSLPLSEVNTPSVPRWYFTSPEPSEARGSWLPSNSRNTWA